MGTTGSPRAGEILVEFDCETLSDIPTPKISTTMNDRKHFDRVSCGTVDDPVRRLDQFAHVGAVGSRGAADPSADARESCFMVDETSRFSVSQTGFDRLANVYLVGQVVPAG